MGQKVTFDPINKIVQVTSPPVFVNGQWEVDLDIKTDVYSDGKEDWLADETLNKFIFPIYAIGGNALPGGDALGTTFFFKLPWKIRPYEADHIFNVDGNLYTDDGSSPFVTTIGDYNILLTQKVSNLVTAIAGDAANIANAVIDYDMSGYNKHLTFGAIQVRDAYNGVIFVDVTNDSGNATAGDEFPVGMPHQPVDNTIDLFTLLDRFHLSRVRIIGDYPVPDTGVNLNGLTMCAGGTIDRTITIPSSATTKGTSFHEIIVSGNLNGRTKFDECLLNDVSNFYGDINDSTISGTLNFDDSTGVTSIIKNCGAGGDGITPTFDIQGTKVSVIDWTGWANLTNKTGSSVLGISVSSGVFEIEPTCSAGIIVIAGIGSVIDNSAPSCIVSQNFLLNEDNISNAVWNHQKAIDLIADVDLINDVEGGKWEVINNQMIFYKSDNTTEILRFNLFDKNGNPAEDNVYRRERI